MNEQHTLRRSLSLFQVIALAAGGMVAAWMVEIQYWFELSGTGSLLALLVCGILVLPLCFIYTEMTSMMPYAGGENIWVSNAFGWFVMAAVVHGIYNLVMLLMDKRIFAP